MPITVDWGNLEETIVVWKFRNKWTQAEFSAAVDQSAQMTRSKPHKVDYIIDLRQSISSPPDLVAMTRSSIQNHHSEMQGHTAVITASDYWQRLLATIVRTLPNNIAHVEFVGTVDEAYALLENRRTKRGQVVI